MSLSDVMSQQLAEKIRKTQEAQNWVCSACTFLNTEDSTECSICLTPNPSSLPTIVEEPATEEVDYESDMALAHQIQLEEEANCPLVKTSNGSSKVILQSGFAPHFMSRNTYSSEEQYKPLSESDDEDFEDEIEGDLWYGEDGKLTSKHDADISGRKNARILEKSFDNAGALSSSGIKLSGKVTSSLRQFNKRRYVKGQRAHGRVDKEHYQTGSDVLDRRTGLTIFKLINAGHINSFRGVVATGKEATVFQAVGKKTDNKWLVTPAPSEVTAASTTIADDTSSINTTTSHNMNFFLDLPEMPMAEEEIEEDIEESKLESSSPKLDSSSSPMPGVESVTLSDIMNKDNDDMDLAVKVFRTTLNEFSKRGDYVEGDHRFQHRGNFKKKNARDALGIWAEKETRNLLRMHRAGVKCPEPLMLRDHILIMEMVGSKGKHAPQLKHVKLSRSRAKKCLQQIAENLRTMVLKAKLAHGDLSEYNIL
eukprot:TRINITY_DN68387_c0_g1_i2.p1 TRINITY_DN68387_c0_g1~~TRINITY_DN68387_c0_g1_i2.p1  ORF type:complete len:480 (-),score=171.74 TRINITY_DN68387_c0_g1_i2:511-1950(-)